MFFLFVFFELVSTALSVKAIISLSNVTLSSDFTLLMGTRIMSKSPGTVLFAVCWVLSGQGFSKDKPVTYVGRQYSAGAYAVL